MIAVAVIVTALFAIYIYAANNTLRVSRYEVSLGNLPEAFDGYTIVQVSDLHDARFGPGQRRLIDLIKQIDPDLCAVTGDIVRSKRHLPRASLRLIEAVSSMYPVFLITGNHEHYHDKLDEVVAAVETAGGRYVRWCEIIERNGARLPVYGIDDPAFFDGEERLISRRRFRDAVLARGREHRRVFGTQAPFLLLSHRPEFADNYAEAGADLVLSGHVHGGVWRLPGGKGVFAPARHLFPRYSGGTYRIGNTTLVVSRGLGPTVIPLRINNPPEVVVITLRCR